MIGAGTIGRADFAGVEVLQDQPASGSEPGDEFVENLETRWNMLQHEPFVNEIPRTLRYRAGRDVQLAHLELRAAIVLEPSCVEINRHHLTVAPDPGGEPTGDRTTARPDLQAAVARLHADAVQVSDRDRIEGLLQALEACTRLRMHVVHQVRGLRHGDHLDS